MSSNKILKNLAIEFLEVGRLLTISSLTLWPEFGLARTRIFFEGHYLVKNNVFTWKSTIKLPTHDDFILTVVNVYNERRRRRDL